MGEVDDVDVVVLAGVDVVVASLGLAVATPITCSCARRLLGVASRIGHRVAL